MRRLRKILYFLRLPDHPKFTGCIGACLQVADSNPKTFAPSHIKDSFPGFVCIRHQSYPLRFGTFEDRLT